MERGLQSCKTQILLRELLAQAANQTIYRAAQKSIAAQSKLPKLDDTSFASIRLAMEPIESILD
jgi:hypothetical protein